MNPNLHQLAYLQQVCEILADDHKQLAARLGYIEKKIVNKHNIHIRGFDPPKLRRCKRCLAAITPPDVAARRGTIVVRCPLCDLVRKFSASRAKRARKPRGCVDKADKESADENQQQIVEPKRDNQR